VNVAIMKTKGMTADDPEARQRKAVMPEIKWLIRQIRPVRRLFVWQSFWVVIGAALGTLDPLLIKWLIDGVLPARNLRLFIIALVIFFLACVGRSGASVLSGIYNTRAIQGAILTLRLRLLKHVHRLPTQVYDTTPVGKLAGTIERDISQIAEVLGDLSGAVLRMVITLVLILFALFMLDPTLSGMLLFLIPAAALQRRWTSPRLKKCSETVRDRHATLSAFLHEHLAALTHIRLLSCQQSHTRRFANLSVTLYRALVDRRWIELYFGSLSTLVLLTGGLIVLGYGGHRVMEGSLTVGALIAFYGYLLRFLDPIASALEILAKTHRLKASVRSVMDIFEIQPTAVTLRKTRRLPVDLDGHIEFRSVSFAYRKERRVLRSINFTLRPGEMVALVGPSGAGKSTIARLLTRLYDVDDGCVLLDGNDIRGIDFRRLRSAVTMIPQDTFIFDGSFRENFLVAKPGATEAELRRVVELAQLEDVLGRLPHGWDERVGPQGASLSGGERQRVAIARAVLQNPRVLALDEVTSALDEETSDRLLDAFKDFARKRTVLLISHRWSTIMRAERMLALSDGKIVVADEKEVFELCSREPRSASKELMKGYP
jgi:ABC-type multidrug transport system fused ATPase/permease subunit